ncbi:enoyl-CoA hydratase-related protein [Aquimonas voraii]|uniref:Methylglutaconyl-CoA hydratase n=1 Tax=Aquimonas voraii TaxID=265719 RepID=A0A1G6STN2_9GAMM|nr:enoyl-CoA hydratase-related protein [Aquimonas voraii]SDD20139.1 methylglutaconyl-CoA hydratase [Aquimonas voraii]
MASESPLNVRTVAGVATLTLDRPKIHNAFDDLLIDELIDALRAIEEDEAVRVVVLTGAGASFSAGADLNWMKRMAQASEKENRKDARQLAKLMRVLNHLDKPTIARVNGAALGGGVGLVACCDIAIASIEARFGLTETRLGLVPAVISPYVIDAIGARQARRLFLTAQVFDAAEAARIGLVHAVVPAAELDAAVDAEVERLKTAGPVAVLEAKRLVQRIQHPDGKHRRALDEANADLIAALRVSDEGQEGLKAFFERRPAGWLEH